MTHKRKKKEKWDLTKLKNMFSAKDTEKNEKISHRLGEIICITYLAKDLYPKVNSKKTSEPI